ncbi:MAG: class I adenylate-forming enzyme family protein, partial [Propionibacteriaceae bacterium]|nr:class I adenylate-forming enzyme family protein [Propionibacteriaceae bacterium]
MKADPITYGSWFAERAWRSAHRIALTFEGRDWTYAEMIDEVDRLAAALAGGGVRPGDRVAYLGENHPRLLQTLIACGRVGAIFVPLNYRLSGGELEHILQDSGTHTLITDAPRQATVQTISDSVPVMRFLGADGDSQDWEHVDDLIANTEPINAPAPVSQDDLAIIMYTSGTTGKPKGVMLTHANLWWCAQ